MIIALLNIGIMLAEGSMLSSIVFGTRNVRRDFLLAVPLSALFTALLTLIFTILSLPIGGWLFLVATLIVLIPLWKLRCCVPQESVEPTKRSKKTRISRGLEISSSVMIGAVSIYAFCHAVLLPSFQYDSATNWTMRSKISWSQSSIAFDETEARGMAKPQYPFLFHALQIRVNAGSPHWSDAAANIIHFLLTISALGCLVYVIARRRGALHAKVFLASLLSIPLLSLHTAQGYGDISLLLYFLLSGLTLWESQHAHGAQNERWLILSGIFVAASVWTKAEGTFFGLLPWIGIILILWKMNAIPKKAIRNSILCTLLLSIPWYLFALSKGFLLTPHSSDTLLSFHPEAVPEALIGLFSRGSFGIAWYALALLVPMTIYRAMKRDTSVDRRGLPVILWGLLVFCGFVFVYLGTPNVRFLLNAESYYRQMMVAAGLIVLGVGLTFQRPKEMTSSGGTEESLENRRA